LDLLTNSLEKIPLSAFGDAFQNSAVQLLSFGLLRPIQVSFPFAPAASDGGEIAEAALKPGQPFPQGSPPHAPFAPLEAIATDAQLTDRLRDLLADLLPDKIELLPGISVDSPGQGVDFLSRAIASNRTEFWAGWATFLASIRSQFGLTESEVSTASLPQSDSFSLAVTFAVAALIRSINDATLFSQLLSKLLIGCSAVDPAVSLSVLSSVVCQLLEQMAARKVYSLTFMTFVCERVQKGWFARQLLDPLSLMLSVCNSCGRPLLETLVCLLIDTFQIVSDEHFPAFLDFFVTHGRPIFKIYPPSFLFSY
jgi:hypothetical protein